MRKFEDTDEEPRVLESFRGLSLDPGSDRYIGRIIGDINWSSEKSINFFQPNALSLITKRPNADK